MHWTTAIDTCEFIKMPQIFLITENVIKEHSINGFSISSLPNMTLLCLNMDVNQSKYSVQYLATTIENKSYQTRYSEDPCHVEAGAKRNHKLESYPIWLSHQALRMIVEVLTCCHTVYYSNTLLEPKQWCQVELTPHGNIKNTFHCR